MKTTSECDITDTLLVFRHTCLEVQAWTLEVWCV